MSRKKDPAVAVLDYFATVTPETGATVLALAKRTLAERLAARPVNEATPLGTPKVKKPRKPRAKKVEKVAWPDEDTRQQHVNRAIAADPLAGR